MSSTQPQYQSFPDAPGDSESLAKLKALRLPLLVGRSFLDIGCNEGFFCGYARFAGAARVVGLDQSERYIARARQRFPALEFLQQSWDSLPAGPFDVILLASALHYASDQAGLINRAMDVLSPNGTLVLELGVAPGDHSDWVEVDRGADKRLFPTWAKLGEILALHAWKLIANSVPQRGDPIPRHILHVNRRKPIAYLLMQPPGFGKTTIARDVFRAAGVPTISGDDTLLEIAAGKVPAPDSLRTVVSPNCTPSSIDKTLLAVVKAGLMQQLVQVLIAKACGKTFALDFYVPESQQTKVEELITACGFLVVRLEWERPGAELMASAKAAGMADAWVAELAAPPDKPFRPMPFTGTLGAVVQLGVNDVVMDVIGWAIHESGFMPKYIGISVGGQMTIYDRFDRMARPQVQERLNLPHAMYGFCIQHPIPAGVDPRDLPYMLEVFGGNDVDTLSGPFATTVLKQAQQSGT